MCSQLFTLLLLALSLTLVTSQQRPRLSRSHSTQTSKHSDIFLKSMEQNNPRIKRHRPTHTTTGHPQTNINEQVSQAIFKKMHGDLLEMEMRLKYQVRHDMSNLTKKVQQVEDLQNEVRKNISNEMDKVLQQIEARLKNQDRKIESINRRKKPVYHLQREKKNWYEAFADCQKQNMDLATFENDDEFEHLLKKINNSTNNLRKAFFWLSAMNFTGKNHYVWISSSKNKYPIEWCPSEPNRFLNDTTKEMENCVQLTHNCMNDYFCSEELNYICENRTDDVLTTTDSKTNKTFEVYPDDDDDDDQRNWFDALVDCRKKGMRLASIDSEDERQHLVTKLNSSKGKYNTIGEFWVSGSDLGRTGHYVWMTTGKSLDHKSLSMLTQPANKEWHCIRMTANETAISYKIYPCYATIYYICESQEDNVDNRK